MDDKYQIGFKYDDLPDAPEYLIQFDENDDEPSELPDTKETNDTDKDIANIEQTKDGIVLTDNIYDSCLVLDELENNSIYPSPIKHKFTPTLSDIPNNVLNPIEKQTPMTADDAANWPIPPWHSPDFVEPIRNEKQIVVNNITKYPEMFVRNENMNEIDIDLYKYEDKQQLMSYEERVSEANIKQQKLERQQEINDYLTKKERANTS